MHGIITLLVLLSSILKVSSSNSSSRTNATDTITTAQLLRDGDTIVSAGQRFELGFFSPGSSKNRYLSIWFKSPSESEPELPTVAWVANREAPLYDTSGFLKVTQEGVISLFNSTDSIIWSSNSPRASAGNPVAKLLDSGNLVLKDADDDDDDEGKNFLWQSFDYPSDTLLPGMKFGRNTVTGLDRYLQSWKSRDDPAPGVFTFGIDPRGYPQYFLRMGSEYQFRMGPWNGLQFSGFPSIHADSRYKFGFVLNQEEMYFFYEDPENVLTRLVLNENGILQRMISTDGAKSWLLYLTLPMANSDIYAFCGAYTSCSNTAGCECLKGFLPNSPKDRSRNRLSGCVRRTPLGCHSSSSAGGDGFLKFPSVKLPDTQNSWFNLSMSLKECETMCLKNCSCVAYANIDVRAGGSGCFLWFGDLFDIAEVTQNGQDLYIRMAASELVIGQAGHRWKRAKRIIVISVVSTGTCILGLAITLYIWKERRRRKRKGKCYKEIKNDDLELPLFDLATINSSTNNFAIKLGEGEFGPVYKMQPNKDHIGSKTNKEVTTNPPCSQAPQVSTQNVVVDSENTKGTRKKMRPRSDVWDHFIRFVDDKSEKTMSRCKYCSREFQSDSKANGTSSLKYHLTVCKKHQVEYKEMARDVLAIPISTVASESAFSTGGRVLDAFRSSLTPKLVQALICSEDWLKNSLTSHEDIEEDLEELEKIEHDLDKIAIDTSCVID